MYSISTTKPINTKPEHFHCKICEKWIFDTFLHFFTLTHKEHLQRIIDRLDLSDSSDDE